MTYQPDDELISAYLDGELTADEEARVEKLLAGNAEARQLYDELRALRASLESLPRLRAPEGLAERVLRRAEREMLATKPSTPSVATPSPAMSAARSRSWRPLVYAVAAIAAAVLIVVTQGVNPVNERPIAKAPAEARRGPTGDASFGAAPKADSAARDDSGAARFKGGKDFDGNFGGPALGGLPAGKAGQGGASGLGAANDASAANADKRAPLPLNKTDEIERMPQDSLAVPGPAAAVPPPPSPVGDAPAPAAIRPEAPRSGRPKAAAAKAIRLEAQPAPAVQDVDRAPAPTDLAADSEASLEMLRDADAPPESAEGETRLGQESAGSLRASGGAQAKDSLDARRRSGFMADGAAAGVVYVRLAPPAEQPDRYIQEFDAALAEQGIEWSDEKSDRLARLPELAQSGARGGGQPSSSTALFAAASGAVDVVYLETTSDAADDVLDSLRDRGFQLQSSEPAAGPRTERRGALPKDFRYALPQDEAQAPAAEPASKEPDRKELNGQDAGRKLSSPAPVARGYAVRLLGREERLSELKMQPARDGDAPAERSIAEKKDYRKQKLDRAKPGEPQRPSKSEAPAGEMPDDDKPDGEKPTTQRSSPTPPRTVRIVFLLEPPVHDAAARLAAPADEAGESAAPAEPVPAPTDGPPQEE